MRGRFVPGGANFEQSMMLLLLKGRVCAMPLRRTSGKMMQNDHILEERRRLGWLELPPILYAALFRNSSIS
jgi:hypothetical protein